MKRLIPAAALLALLAGCQAPAGKPEGAGVNLQAQTALLQAEQDIKLAKEKKGDTTKAEALLAKAKEAAASGDSAATTKLAGESTKASMQAIKDAAKKK